jgi:glycosyltransferase involved in cell wall biosynthesis
MINAVMEPMPARLAVVVPMYNEAANIDRFVDRLSAAMAGCDVEFAMILVDDGSTDGTVSAASAQASRFPGSEVVELSRNFGKEAALLAGMDAALRGEFDVVVMMDADLQHPPESIPAMLRAWQSGNDVVIAARASRAGDSFVRHVFTRLFYGGINRMAEIPVVDGDGDFRLLTRDVVAALCALREQHRFTKGLYAWVGFRQHRMHVEYEARTDGASRFGPGKLISLAANALTSFSAKPLRLALFFGMTIGAISLAYAGWIALSTLMFGKQLPGYASIFCGMMFLGGVQLVCIGLLGEYVGRTYIQSKSRPPYVVRRVIRGDNP